MKDDFLLDLIDLPTSFLVSKWLTDRVPYLFGEKNEEFILWKEELSKRLNIDSKAIVFTGSSSCGFSMNPNKNYRDFNEKSDIDIALISNYHFDIAWRTLRDLGTKVLDLTPKQKSAYYDHIKRLIYWGTIATDKILEILPFGKDWSLELMELSKLEPANDRVINIRIYKDFEALRAYQVQNFENLKITLLQEENGKLFKHNN